MKESYSDEIMLCFVQGFRNGNDEPNYFDRNQSEVKNNLKLFKKKRISLQVDNEKYDKSKQSVDIKKIKRNPVSIVAGKSLKLTTNSDIVTDELPDVKRSFSDRFSLTGEVGVIKGSRRFLTIRKTRSTGNFAPGSAGAGGCGGVTPRSAPATPLQLEPHPSRNAKNDKQAVKHLSNSAPSVRTPAQTTGGAGSVSVAATEREKDVKKPPSKARQKKFLRHFPQVESEERVLNYYSCALVGDILLQGHLYITKNYFAFYSNVFGYVTKLLIPTSSVQRVTKEKMARIIPNAVGVCTHDERHVFGSLLSRDSTYKLMTNVWKAAGAAELAEPPAPKELRVSEVELDVSEYSPEDESSSGGAEFVVDGVRQRNVKKRENEAIINPGGIAAVIQPALLTGGSVVVAPALKSREGTSKRGLLLALLIGAALLLAISAMSLGYRLHERNKQPQIELSRLSGAELYSELVSWRARLHGRAATELHAFLSTNLVLLTKVRQSLQALSSVILTDMAHAPADQINIEVPINNGGVS